MRFTTGFVFSLLVAVSCTNAAVDEPLAEPVPAKPEEPSDPGDSGSAPRPAEEVCGDLDDLGTNKADACTEIGCQSGFHLDVRPLDSWPHGNYRYVLDVDGGEVTCEGSLPLRGCEERSITCSDTAFVVTESGCALPAKQHAFGGVTIPDFPSRVHLRVELDGKAVADEDLEVDWNRSQPNGPGCPPICCQAGDSVELIF
jgi:hypothetical protein